MNQSSRHVEGYPLMQLKSARKWRNCGNGERQAFYLIKREVCGSAINREVTVETVLQVIPILSHRLVKDLPDSYAYDHAACATTGYALALTDAYQWEILPSGSSGCNLQLFPNCYFPVNGAPAHFPFYLETCL